MADVVVTLPKSFGLDKWLAEGDAAGTEPSDFVKSGGFYHWKVPTTPKIEPGERVYIVYDGRLIGYAPLISLRWDRYGKCYLIRRAGAVACTLNRHIPGFQGYRYRWWDRDDELPTKATCAYPGCSEEFDLGYDFPGLCGGEKPPDHGCGEPFCEKHLFTADEHRHLVLCESCCEGYFEYLAESAGV